MRPSSPSVAWVYAFANSFLAESRLEMYLDADAAAICNDRLRSEWRALRFKVKVIEGSAPPTEGQITPAVLDSGSVWVPVPYEATPAERDFVAVACPRAGTSSALPNVSAPSLDDNFQGSVRPKYVIAGENFFFTAVRLLAGTSQRLRSLLGQKLEATRSTNRSASLIWAALDDAADLVAGPGLEEIDNFGRTLRTLLERRTAPSADDLLLFLYAASSATSAEELSPHAQTLAMWRRSLSRNDLNLDAREARLSEEDVRKRLKQLAIDEPSVGRLLGILHYGPQPTVSVPPEGGWLLAQPLQPGSNTIEPLARYRPVPVAVNHSGDRGSSLLSALGGFKRGVVDGYFARRVVARPLIPWSDHTDQGHAAMVSADSRSDIPGDAEASFPTLEMHRSSAHAMTRSQWIDATDAAQKALEEVSANKPDNERDGDHYASMIETIVTTVPPYDAIAITWDQAHVVNAIRGADRNSDVVAHSGFKGNRVDVQTRHHETGSWRSLSAVRRYVVGPDGRRAYECGLEDGLPREKYVTPSVQGQPKNRDSESIIVGSHFVVWGGSSAVLNDPLDQLASPGGEGEGLIKLEESSLSVPHVAYGDICRFRVRKVGLTGISPLWTHKGDSTTNRQFGWAEIPFKRATPMAAPVVDLVLEGFHQIQLPEGPNGLQESVIPSDLPTNGGNPVAEGALWKVTRRSAARIAVQSPLAHWRVAKSATPFDPAAQASDDFRKACFSFAKRALAKLRPGSVPSTIPDATADYLAAFDPHLKDVEIVTRAWYPFSDRDTDDPTFSVFGSSRHSGPRVKKSFTDLIVAAQRSIEQRGHDFELTITVADRGMPSGPQRRTSPRLIPGAPMRIECYGRVDDDAWGISWWNRADPVSLGRAVRRWTSTILIAEVESSEDKSPIGSPRRDLAGLTVRLSYCGLLDEPGVAHRERRIPMVPRRSALPVLGDPPEPPLRGTVQSWRAHHFDDPNVSLITEKRRRELLLAFMAPRIGGKVIDTDKPELRLTVEPLLGHPRRGPAYVESGLSWPTPTTFPAPPPPAVPLPHGTIQFGRFDRPRNADDPKELPFIDRDIRWVVRLAWNVPLDAVHLERPRDIMFVKDFEVYRRDLIGGPSGQGESRTLLGRIKRPGADILTKHNLDEIEWTWIDTVTDGLPHRFEYTIVAVPEYDGLLASAEWFRQEVVVASSDIGARPAVVALPLLSTGKKGVALHVRGERRVIEESRLVYRTAQLQADPLVGGTATTPNPSTFKEPSVEEVFPASHVEPVVEANPPAAGHVGLPGKGWQLAVRARTPVPSGTTAHPTVWACDLDPMASKTGNPFAKLEVALVPSHGYPRLQHTVASDILETEWLQAYPPPLGGLVKSDRELKIDDAWPVGPTSLIWHRYHLFVGGVRGTSLAVSSFHLATFYRREASLNLDVASPGISSALVALLGAPPPENTRHLVLLVFAEEGILAKDYALDGDRPLEGNPELVVMRSMRTAFELDCDWSSSEQKWVC